MRSVTRVLFLTPGCFDKGGISRYCRYQICALREILGAENVEVLSLLGPDGDSFETPFVVDWTAGGAGLIEKAAFAAKVASRVGSGKPDVVWTAHVAFAGLVRVTAALAGAQTVVNEYGLEAWSDLGADAAWGLQGMTHVLSDCHFTARWMEAAGKRPPGSIKVVWDCVDLDRFSPGDPNPEVLRRYGLPAPGSGVSILTLGRMSRAAAHKGFDRLLEAFALASREAPTLRLVYAGKGNLVEELREHANTLGVGERVFFTGMIGEKDLVDVYRSAEMFSLVSDRGEGRGEGIPLTPLEAAACGVPILVGNHDGSQEAVVDGVSGYLLDPFDLERHARAMVTLSADVDLRRKMGEAARRRIEAEFSYPGFVEKHRGLLQEWFGTGKRALFDREGQE